MTFRRIFSLFTAITLSLGLVFALSADALAARSFTYSSVEAYAGTPYAEVNGNIPEFEPEEYTCSSFETYSELDGLGRCGAAYACVGTDLMPTQRQGSAGSVTPTGWINVKYEIVPGGYVYNRCHLIGYQLTGENANRRNLITGTRYMNVEGMLPFEDAVADYVKATGNHVLYRVTPVFVGDELVARGVLMEALSMEDGGDGVRFCVFCYNVQPGVVIDYATGISRLASSEPEARVYTVVLAVRFVANTNTMKYHLPECTYAASMSPRNRAEMTATPVQMAEEGYSPCSRCRPDESAQTVTYRYGDADADGDVTPADARLVLRFAVELDAFTDWQRVIADVDGDDRITPADARKVLRAAVGLGTI